MIAAGIPEICCFPPLMAIRIEYRQWIRIPIRIHKGQMAKGFFVKVS
jgi:hypothetical protein